MRQQPRGGLLKAPSATFSADPIARQVGVVAGRERLQLRFHVADQRSRVHPLVACQLAPDQVVGLDAGRALVDRGDARIAQILRGAGLLDEAHAAVHLDAGGGDHRSSSRCTSPSPPASADRRDACARPRSPASGCVRRAVHAGGRAVGQRAHRLGARLHVHQHPAHVGMLDDRQRRSLRCRWACPARARGHIPRACW